MQRIFVLINTFMILSNVQTLCSFPFEKVGIFLDPSVLPESNVSTSINFRSSVWANPTSLIKFNNPPPLVQGGLLRSLSASTTLSSYYDVNLVQSISQPSAITDIPSDFPFFFAASAIPNHYLALSFDGGLSSISLFPTSFFPVLSSGTVNGVNVLTVSGGIAPLVALDGSFDKSEYYRTLPLSSVQPISNSYSLASPNVFYSAHREDFVWSTTGAKAVQLIGTTAKPVPIPSVAPYDTNLITDSFVISFPLSSSLSDEINHYSMNVESFNTTNNLFNLSGFMLNGVSPFAVRAGADTFKNDAWLLNRSGIWKLYLKLNPQFAIPPNSNITLSYDTSATASVLLERTAGTTKNLRLGTNFHSITTYNQPYNYSYTFPITSTIIPTQDAFTISFFPSATFAYPSSADDSYVTLNPIMVDTTQQLFLPMKDEGFWQVSFEEASDDITLFAQQQSSGYIALIGQDLPAFGDIKIFNDGNANSYDVTMKVTSLSTGAAYYSDPFNIVLNRSQARVNLVQLSADDFSAIVQGDTSPNLDADENVQWSAYPSDNILFYDYSNGVRGDAILPNVDTKANQLMVEVVNLGVEPTTITLYSNTYGASGSTVWVPTTATFNNLTLSLSGTLESKSSQPVLDLKASVVKSNLLYNVPGAANITWNNNTLSHIEFFDNNSNFIAENAVYPGQFIFSNIKPILHSNFVAQNPQLQAFNINANVFSPYFNINANKIFSIPEYPANASVTAILSASDGKIIDTAETESLFFTHSNTITAVANVNAFSNLDSLQWSLPNGSIATGLSTVFTLSSNFCLGLTAFNAIPNTGGFGAYDFVDSICLFVLSSAPPQMRFVAFPEYKFLPTQKLAIEDGSYLTSTGLKYLASCGTQNFIISTFPGFDSYHYTIGNASLFSNSNAVTMPVTFADISSNNAVAISAFNPIFVNTDPVTIYNSVSSTGTNFFNGFVQVQSPTLINPTVTIDNSYIDVSNLADRPISINIDYSNANYDAVSTDFVFVLSSANFQHVSDVVSFPGNKYQTDVTVNFEPTNPFSIPENSFNSLILQLSGTVLKVPKNYDSCGVSQVLNANWTTLTAFDGPYPEIFTEFNLHKTFENVVFQNYSGPQFTEFYFDDGYGHVQHTFSTATPLSGRYNLEGMYSPAMTAYYLDSRPPVIRTWNDFIVVKDTFAAYNSAINRQFPDDLVLPYSKDEILITPDAWQHASTLNDTFDKIKTNVEFLSSMSFTYNANLPKNYIGWLGEKNQNVQWRYEPAPDVPFATNVFSNIKDISINQTKTNVVLINDNTIEIRNLDQTLSLVLSSDHITRGEAFKNPIRTGHNATLNKLIVLDRDNKSVYAFDWNTFDLTHYWGGVGPVYSHTHFNDPSDLFVDANDMLYVVDSADKVVKIYNSYLNWTGQIAHAEFTDDNRPISCTASDNYIFVLAGKTVYKFNHALAFIESFEVLEGTKLYVNEGTNGLLYILGTNLSVYTIDGVFINKKSYVSPIVGMAFKSSEVFAANAFSLIKFIDYLDTFSVTVGTPNLWDWTNLWIDEREMVTDFVLNDSFKKLQDNLYLVANSVKYKYSVELDENYDLISHAISAIQPVEKLLIAPPASILGTNEIVAYETINRNISNIFASLELVRQMLNVRRDFSTTDICWTWKKHKIAAAQNTSRRINPYSWYELRSDTSANNPLLSGVKWENAMSCQEEVTVFPICYNWNTLGCNCLFPLSWDQMDQGRHFAMSWATLTSQCCVQPTNFFDNCTVVC